MKPILVVIVYLCNENMSKQLFEQYSNNLTDIIKAWQVKLPNVDIIHMILAVKRDSAVSIKLLKAEALDTGDRVVLKQLQKHLSSSLNNTTLNSAKSFYE